MIPVEITRDIWWVGVQNPTLRVFDVVMHTEWGTSYNSYLVKGSEKTALIDSVRDGFLDEQLAGISQLCVPEEIDYIIVQHTEPDHSGSLKEMLELAPHAKVVCSRPAKMLIEALMNKEIDAIIVGDGDSIDLGGKTLEFISAPFLHWPDTIFTYIKEEKFLATCDAFGFHMSSPRVFDDLIRLPKEDVLDSQKYYFDVIMSPFKEHILNAVAKIEDLDIDVVAPSHGPVLRAEPWESVKRYKEWSQPTVNDPKKIYIGYVSCYGYTTLLAQQVYKGAKSIGLDVEMEDISEIAPAEVATKMTNADGFALGSPTLNRDVMPPVNEAMTHLTSYKIQNKPAAVFGTFGWSGEATKFMEERLNNLGAKVQGKMRAKMKPSEEELVEAFELGKTLAQTIADK